ncbi:MAG: phosphoenolpyruvate--protein phosphotransferase [Nocardioidaceae bacterium]
MQPSARYTGTPVVPGAGYGPVVRPAPVVADDPVGPGAVEPDEALIRFAVASESVAQRLEQLSSVSGGATAEVLAATAALARDRGLAAFVRRHVECGADVVAATRAAVAELSEMFRAAGGVMAERVADLTDVRDRIVAALTGRPEPGVPVPDEPSVLLAHDLAPVDTAALDPALIVAIATEVGGPTSHTAIIARQLGIPCVVAVTGLADVATGRLVLVDGDTGEVIVEPDADAARSRVRDDRASREQMAAWRGPGRTRDGHPVEVLANVQDLESSRLAALAPVEGVGLFRTELCFLDSASEPSVEAQAAVYAKVLSVMGSRKVVVRTLDAGSDKPLCFVRHREEANPALGVRGLRIARDDPGILSRQLDAIALAASGAPGPVWVMAPMVSTVAEAAGFGAAVRQRGLVAGAMVEVPSAALRAAGLLEHLDFVSIGTNDLSQYALAADRMAPTLSDLTDPWQPALLQLVSMTAEAGLQAGKPVGVCGEAAADPVLSCVLVGLGVTSLSVATSAAAAVGARLAAVTHQQCAAAAEAAVACDSAEAARAAALRALGG